MYRSSVKDQAGGDNHHYRCLTIRMPRTVYVMFYISSESLFFTGGLGHFDRRQEKEGKMRVAGRGDQAAEPTKSRERDEMYSAKESTHMRYVIMCVAAHEGQYGELSVLFGRCRNREEQEIIRISCRYATAYSVS